YARHCRAGRAQVRAMLRDGCDLVLTDLEADRQELVAEGAAPSRACVVPPIQPAEGLHLVQADLEVANARLGGVKNLVAVGRLLPEKSYELLLDAIAVYHDRYDANSCLAIVGEESEHVPGYRDQLGSLAARLGVAKAVTVTGAVSDAVLKAY